MGDYLSDIPPVTITFRGRVDGLRQHGNRAVASIRVPHDGNGIPLSSWTVGDSLELATSATDGSVCDLTIVGGVDGPILDIDTFDASEEEATDVLLSLVDSASAVSVDVDGLTWQHQVMLGGRTPSRWIRLPGDELLIGIDDGGYLALVVFRTSVPVPAARRITIRLDDGGSSTAYGTRSVMVSTDRRFDPNSMSPEELEAMYSDDGGGACERVEHLDGFDGNGDLMLSVDSALRSLDAPATSGVVVVPEADESADELDVTITWPAKLEAVVEVLSPETARFRVQLDGGEAQRWIDLGGLLAGVTGDDLVELVVAEAEHVPQDDWMFGKDGDGWDPTSMDQDAMLAMHRTEMERQFAREFERAEEFANDPPWPVFVPADPPDLPVLMEPQESSWGGARIASVTMRWDDHAAMFDPERAMAYHEARNTLPRIEVETSAERQFEPPGHEHPANGYWLVETERSYDRDQSMPTPRQMEDDQAEMERRARELEVAGEPTTLTIAGSQVEGTIVRTESAYVATCEVDGRRITVRAANLGAEPPTLIEASDLREAVAGFRASRERMLDSMRTANAAGASVPSEIAEARTAVDGLISRLQAGSVYGSSRPGGRRWSELFAPAVVDLHGGAEAFNARFGIIAQAVQGMSGVVFAMDREATCAHVHVDVNLPRPDGGGVGRAYGIAGDFWDHSPEEVRDAGTSQLDRGEMADHELVVNLLAVRQPDGSFAIETDLLGLIERLTGGIDGLLGGRTRSH